MPRRRSKGRVGKFGVSPKADRTYDGQLFASKREMQRWIELQHLQRAGLIRGLRRQVRYDLILPDGTPIKVGKRTAVFTPDFVYEELKAGQWAEVIEDLKGRMTNEAKFRIAVFSAIYQKEVAITR